MGRTVDMTELMAKNERTRAVGNMKVNARGDTIDAHGKIIEPVTSKVNSQYAKTVGNRSAQPLRNQRAMKPPRKGNEPLPPVNKKPVNRPMSPTLTAPAPAPAPELTSIERELEEDMQDDLEVEQIKARENKNGN
jgi:hypothetical protein